MYQGHLPILTKGPFSIFYGGEQIMKDLSKQSPGIGSTLQLVVSVIFQISLYIVKQVKSRKLQEYPQILKMTIVDNVLNMYSIMIIIILSIIAGSYGLLHHWSIEKLKVSQVPTRLVPREIVVLYFLLFACVACPFVKSYALR